MIIDHFEKMRKWYEKGDRFPFLEENWCYTRGDANARLQTYVNVISRTFDPNQSFLVTAIIGELLNNCFDHNLGYWQGEPGCVFVRERDYCIVADRGRGFRNSLSDFLMNNNKRAIDVAFNEVVSGRYPERRGNGLKFVKKNLKVCNLNMFVVSCGEHLNFGNQNVELKSIKNSINSGVFYLLWWET